MADAPNANQTPNAENGSLIIDPYGQYRYIEPAQVQEAVQSGFRVPSADEAKEFHLKQQYGDSPWTAAAEAALGDATFGGSRWLENKLGITTPEAQAAREKYNPTASTLGGLAGVGAAMLTPAGWAEEGAGLLARGASALSAPVKAVSKIGSAVTEAALPVTKGAASAVMGAERMPGIQNVLARAAATGAGSAVEGAFFGAGKAFSEAELGDPDLNAEKVMSNIGYTALAVGKFGAVLGGVLAPFAKAADAAAKGGAGLSGAAEASGMAAKEGTLLPKDSFESSLSTSALNAEEKEALLKGIRKLKTNVDEIDAAASRQGIEAFPGQRSDSELIQKRYSQTLQSPTPVGTREAQRVQASAEKLRANVDQAIGQGAKMSEAELGNAQKKSILESVAPEVEEINAAFEGLKEYSPAIPVSNRASGTISRNILKLDGLVNAEGKALSPKSPEWRFVKDASENIKGLKTLEDLKNFRSILRRETYGDPSLRYVAGQIQERLANLEIASIERFADTMKKPAAREKVGQLVGRLKDARARYASLADNLSELAEIGGKRKVYGPQDFLDFVEGIVPEKLAKNSVRLAKNNSEKLQFLKDNYPAQFNLIRDYIKNDIREAATKKGSLNLMEAWKQVDALSKEAREMLFSTKELQTLKDAKTWAESWGEKLGPSGTPQGIDYSAFYGGFKLAAAMTARDWLHLEAANAAAGVNSAAKKAAALAQIERMADSSAKAVKSGASAIFSAGKELATGRGVAYPAAIYAGMQSPEQQKKKHDEVVAIVKKLSTNPEAMIEAMEKNTAPIAEIAPKIATSMSASAARATAFLHSKLPPAPQPLPLSKSYTPSNSEISKFGRYHAAVENPAGVLHDVARGQVTPEAIEAVQTVYPSLYKEMQVAVTDKLADHMAKGKSLPYSVALALGAFLQRDLTNSMTSESIAANQIAIAASAGKADQERENAAQNGSVKTSSKGLSNLTTSERLLTASQASANRGGGA